MKFSAFFYALSLLTTLPVPRASYDEFDKAELRSRSIVYFVFVGLIIGALLSVAILLLAAVFPPGLTAGLVLLSWVAVTGALHLDGLADCSDAFFAHHQYPEKVLSVMKEPTVGAMAVVAIVLLLLLKFAALQGLLFGESLVFFAIVFACIAARVAAALYMLITPYVSRSGIVSGLDFKHHRVFVIATALVSFVFLAVLCGALIASSVAIVVAFTLWLWRRVWMKRIKGYTGDCVGALIEIVECLCLMVFLACSS